VNILIQFLTIKIGVVLKSDDLLMESKKAAALAKRMNYMLLWRKYGPLGIVALIVLLFLYIRIWWW
jgi:hypothetical protein